MNCKDVLIFICLCLELSSKIIVLLSHYIHICQLHLHMIDSFRSFIVCYRIFMVHVPLLSFFYFISASHFTDLEYTHTYINSATIKLFRFFENGRIWLGNLGRWEWIDHIGHKSIQQMWKTCRRLVWSDKNSVEVLLYKSKVECIKVHPSQPCILLSSTHQ